MGLFSRRSQHQIGIDIGTSSVKAIELKQEGSRLKLENYGVIFGLDFLKHVAKDPTDRATFKMSEDEMAQVIKKLLSFSNIKAEEAVFPVPIFSSFLTVVDFPSMTMEELEKAISLQAQSYIPVPLNEVVLDWVALPEQKKEPSLDDSGKQEEKIKDLTSEQSSHITKSTSERLKDAQEEQGKEMNKSTATATIEKRIDVGQEIKDSSKISVLLVAIPREVIEYYERIAELSGLKVKAIESEGFSMVRSLVGNDLQTTMLVDLGARSSTLTIVDQGFVRVSHTVDFSGKELTDNIAQGLNISNDRAEELKKKEGFSGGANAENMKQVLSPALTKLILEYKKMADYYNANKDVKIEKVILTGGSSFLPGLHEYLSEKLNITIVSGNPFARTTYPQELKKVLESELAPHLAVATGAAMRDFD